MASSAVTVPDYEARLGDDSSDYGSEFSPEEEEILNRLLLAGEQHIEDNPIVTGVEYHDPARAVRLPRALPPGGKPETLEVRETFINDFSTPVGSVDGSTQAGKLIESLNHSMALSDLETPSEI
jgi:hypothetical protein